MKQHLFDVNHVLLDIEGTICPISFVKDVLFPYALRALPEVAEAKWADADFRKYKANLPSEFQESPEKLTAHIKDLTERNIKIAYFKELQGYLWEDGYKSGAYSSPFFADVVPVLRRWQSVGIGISIYSSGSVFAQKLLFGHVDANDPEDPKATVDLRSLVTDWFDTTNAGPKTAKESYVKICRNLNLRPENVLFLSDNVKELEAAREASMKVALVVREGNEEVNANDRDQFDLVETFQDLKVTKRAGGGGNLGEDKRASIESEDRENRRGHKHLVAEVGGPPHKKQKAGGVRKKGERHSPQRRSMRLQQARD